MRQLQKQHHLTRLTDAIPASGDLHRRSAAAKFRCGQSGSAPALTTLCHIRGLQCFQVVQAPPAVAHHPLQIPLVVIHQMDRAHPVFTRAQCYNTKGYTGFHRRRNSSGLAPCVSIWHSECTPSKVASGKVSSAFSLPDRLSSAPWPNRSRIGNQTKLICCYFGINFSFIVLFYKSVFVATIKQKNRMDI